MKPFFILLLILSVQPALGQKRDSTQLSTDSANAKSLQGVVITSAKKGIEILPDKVVLNLDAQAPVGENVWEVLRRSPGVVIDGADNMQLNGKSGITVLIDGKNTQLSAQELAQLLKGTEAANVRQIELIGNPSAKYDAAGGGGIINIKLKKSLTDGFNGSATGSYVQSNHARQNATTNLNWRKGKTALFLNAGVNNGRQNVTAINNRSAGPYTYIQNSLEKEAFGGETVRLGGDYTMDKKNTLGVQLLLNNRTSNMDNGSTTAAQNANGEDTFFITRSLAPFRIKRRGINLNYQYTNDGFEYSMDADYTLHRSSVNNVLTNDVLNNGGTKIGSNATTNNQQVEIELYALKGDLIRTLSSKLKLEAGFKGMRTQTANSLVVQNSDGILWATDTGKTNLFSYNEAIAAGYASLQGTGEKLSWQVGLRAEHTSVEGRSIDLRKKEITEPDTVYLNLFPTLFLQYKVSEQHQLGLAANRRIDRPNYQDQNPFIYFLDALNTEQGNAYLKPQYTNSIEVSYTYKYATALKISYARTTDYIEWLTYQNEKYTVQTPQNSGVRQALYFSLSSPFKVTKWWSGYLSLTPYYHHYSVLLSGFGNRETQQGGSWAFNSYVGNNIDFGKGWKGNFGGWFNFQNRATIYISKPLGSFDLGVQKSFLKDKATLKLAAVDVFNTQKWEQTATTEILQMNTYRKWESRNITLGFSIRFGNSKVKNARDRKGGNEDALNRIK